MKSDFYESLDINFVQALKMSEREFSHEELIEMLKNGNIPQRQIAAIRLDGVNEKESQILFDNLTGCDGKIREAAALKINQLLNVDKKYVKMFTPYDMNFSDATIDINGNICRLVIDSVAIMKTDKDFSERYLERLLNLINEAFKGLDEIIFRDKKYKINKQLFKLYWCLESLKLFAEDIKSETLYPILERTSQEREYTIREKSAQILVHLEDSIYDVLKSNLKNDENYYVRAVFKN